MISCKFTWEDGIVENFKMEIDVSEILKYNDKINNIEGFDEKCIRCLHLIMDKYWLCLLLILEIMEFEMMSLKLT